MKTTTVLLHICRTMFEVFPEGCHGQLCQKRLTYLSSQGRSLNCFQPHEVEVDGWDKWRTIHTRWCTSNCWWMRVLKESMPDDVRNNCRWIRPIKDFPYQMMYKTTVDGQDRCRISFQMHEATVNGRGKWKNPYQMMHETTVDGCCQWRTTNIGWSTNNCWWTRERNESMPDDVRNNCWWIRPTKA